MEKNDYFHKGYVLACPNKLAILVSCYNVRKVLKQRKNA